MCKFFSVVVSFAMMLAAPLPLYGETGQDAKTRIANSAIHVSGGEDGGATDTIAIDGENLSDFRGVSLGNQLLEQNVDYEVCQDSVVIKLKPAFLDTLSPGRYTLRVSFTGSYADAEIAVGKVKSELTGSVEFRIYGDTDSDDNVNLNPGTGR